MYGSREGRHPEKQGVFARGYYTHGKVGKKNFYRRRASDADAKALGEDKDEDEEDDVAAFVENLLVSLLEQRKVEGKPVAR